METKDLMQALQQGVKDVFNSDRWKQYLAFCAKFHNYSHSNIMLILLQRPNATRVAGFNTWRNTFGRTVNKGEKGITILAPMPYKVEHEKSDGERTTETKLRFQAVYVFDVSQTSGRELPRPIDELGASVAGYVGTLNVLREISPFPVEIREIEGGAKGYCNFTNQTIYVRSGMSEAQTVKTLIHEIAHAGLHDRRSRDGQDKSAVDRRTAEVEAESIAFVVCNYLGIDSSDYTFGYIAGWSSGKETPELTRSLATIQQHAQKIIEDIGRVQERVRVSQNTQRNPDVPAPIDDPSQAQHSGSTTVDIRGKTRRAKQYSVER